MKRAFALVFLVVVLASSCSTPDKPVVRFNEQEQADFIVRYYTDDTIYVLKPQAPESQFQSVFKKNAALDLAKQQPSRQLAVVILVPYKAESQTEAVKDKWESALRKIGYQRVVFLRSGGGMKVNGLPVLAGGG
jgi:hypothetical protein